MEPATTDPSLNLLFIEADAHTELDATGADLFVSIRGNSYFVGNAARQKAREVQQFVADLRQSAGLAEEHIQIEAVEAESSGGAAGKFTSVRYDLRIVCPNLEVVPAVLGVVTALKNGSLTRIRWDYGDEEAARDTLLERCVTRANRKAALVARTLGVTITGVRSFTEKLSSQGAESRFRSEDEEVHFGRTRAKVAPLDLGQSVSHRKRLTAQVQVQYRVSGFSAP